MGLKINRKVGQSVLIGEDVVVTIEQVHGNHLVTLDIEAPRSISIHREEIFLKSKESILSDI